MKLKAELNDNEDDSFVVDVSESPANKRKNQASFVSCKKMKSIKLRFTEQAAQHIDCIVEKIVTIINEHSDDEAEAGVEGGVGVQEAKEVECQNEAVEHHQQVEVEQEIATLQVLPSSATVSASTSTTNNECVEKISVDKYLDISEDSSRDSSISSYAEDESEDSLDD